MLSTYIVVIESLVLMGLSLDKDIGVSVAVSDTVRGYAIVSGLFVIILSLLGA